MNRTSWIIFSVVAVGILALLVVTSKNSEANNLNGVDIYAVQTASSKNGNIADHVFGKTDSKVTLIEYGDYQCPPCASVSPIIKSVTTDYAGKIRYIFRNFPISSLHPNALTAASVAEAASLQGKYWEMHDKLYDYQSSWSNLGVDKRIDYFAGLTKQLELDESKFRSDINLNSISAKIKYDKSLGEKAGVSGTPTFYLNGTKMDNSTLFDATKLKTALDAELKKTSS